MSVPLDEANIGAVETALCPVGSPARLGRVTLAATSLAAHGRFEAWSFARLSFVFTAGELGMDDGGHLRIAYRWTHDGGGLQVDRPQEANFVTAVASNGAELAIAYGSEAHTRPFDRAVTVTVRRGFLAPGDTLAIVIGDTTQGSPGFRLQSFAESAFRFRILVDAMATQHYTQLLELPSIAIVPAPAVAFRLLAPTRRRVGEAWQVALRAEDRFGNPADFPARNLALDADAQLAGIDAVPRVEGAMLRWEALRAEAAGSMRLFVRDRDTGEAIANAPVELVAADAPIAAWADLHGQSGETVGINSVEDYFAFARDIACLDAVAHQANDFQITDRFWDHLNAVTARTDEPGRFVAFPGYEWSGNTAVGGDRNVLYRHEGERLHRSCRALVLDRDARDPDAPTARILFETLAGSGADAVCFAHVGGRYADLAFAHDPRLERAIEIHSCWGTFEWLLEDALRLGLRVGVVANSDDHKGRPGAAHPGASTFGALGGLTCLLVERIDRDGVFAAMRARRHFATTGERLDLAVVMRFAEAADRLDEDRVTRVSTATMGDIVRTHELAPHVCVQVRTASAIERIELRRGAETLAVLRPGEDARARGSRLRLQWEGALYRGRGRQVSWNGEASLTGVRVERVAPFGLWSPHHGAELVAPGRVAWRAVTTGNRGGVDLFLAEESSDATIEITTGPVSTRCRLSEIGADDVVIEAGGLGRRMRLFRLPRDPGPCEGWLESQVPCEPRGDTAVLAVVTLENGHRAWTSPIYLTRET
jgi:hypothetical protein